MKKLLLISNISIVVLILITSTCSAAADRLDVVGTGSGAALLEALANEFNEQNKEVIVTIPESIGSGGGIRAVGNDDYIMGRVARDIQEKEKKYGLALTPIAKIPIVFYVNSSVSLSGLTSEQACGIFSGEIRKWEELNGGTGKIRVIRREDGDSSLIVLEDLLPGFKDITLTERSKITYTDQETLEECRSQNNSITFGNYTDVKNENGVKALEIDEINPADPKYPYFGFISLVYKPKNYSGNLQKFIEFISTDTGKRIIIDAGGFPIE